MKTNVRKIINIVKRVFVTLPVLAALLWMIGGSTVVALTTGDLKSIIKNTPFYKPDDTGLVTTCTTGGVTGGYDPLTLTFPAFPDENAIGTSIDQFIASKNASSPWLSLQGISSVGAWLVTQSKALNINPLFIVASGLAESTFGSSSVARANNNYFGIKASGNTYVHYPTPTIGIQSFMDKVQKNTQGGSSTYAAAKTIYEYFSIHQTGGIFYPGDPFDPNDRDTKPGVTQDSYDPIMNVWISWTTTDHPNNAYDGQLFNPLGYYKIIIGAVNAITGLSLPAVPIKPGGGACGGQTGSGNVDPNGYAFPLAPQNHSVGGITDNQTITTHHDGTAAFDLFSTEGADVYAVYGGTPTKINTNFTPAGKITEPGCTSIMFHADDGFYYWYGHMMKPVVAQGTHVAAGTKLGQIADHAHFTQNCWEGAPHLHIDRGCTINGIPQPGGRDACRDPAFIVLLGKLYATLP